MTRTGFALSMIAVVGAAAWAYHINYLSKTTLGRVDQLRRQIAAEREEVEVLRVEWAYLNAPERLALLVALNNDELGLAPLSPDHFDEVTSVPFPARSRSGASSSFGAEIEIVVSEPLLTAARTAPLPAPRPVGWRLE